MIETEEAFMHLSDFTQAAFLSIGSNDLGKSLFQIDRSSVMDELIYAKMMVKAIEEIDQFAKHHQIPCTVCGDIASRPVALAMMLEKNIHAYSIPMPFLKEAKQIIKQFKTRI
jgi:phosphoenolpyruvate-protein kinase (PTS system EI component)